MQIEKNEIDNIKEEIESINKVPGKVYLVGGAVRDLLMDKEPKDYDFLVDNVTEKEMVNAGFNKVGADFPVFLDEEGREFALPRVEKKTSEGYKGFEIETEGVSVEEDLGRRDFTINAMAYDLDSYELIDPFDGKEDLKVRMLRQVSDAFKEDPLRVMRLARFASRLEHSIIDVSTFNSAKKASPELEEVANERITQELLDGLREAKKVEVFIRLLSDTGALEIFLPELEEARTKEVFDSYLENVYEHSIEVTKRMNKKTNDEEKLLATLLHDIGKIHKYYDDLSFKSHIELGLDTIDKISKRLKFSNSLRRKLKGVCEYHHKIFYLSNLSNQGKVAFVQRVMDHPDITFELLLDIRECDLNTYNFPFDSSIARKNILNLIDVIKETINEVDGDDIMNKYSIDSGKKVGQKLVEERANILEEKL